MTQEFLNTEKKPYSELTREQKHTLLDATIDQCIEFYCGGDWFDWNSNINSHNGIYRTKPKEYKKLDIPWQIIEEKWKYAAMDGDGEMFLFEEKPTWKNNLWIDYSEDGECIQLYNILKLDTTGIVAEHSLTQRPEGV